MKKKGNLVLLMVKVFFFFLFSGGWGWGIVFDLVEETRIQ